MIDWLRKVLADPRTERAIMAVIVVNAVVQGLATSPSIMTQFPILRWIEGAILFLFVIELTARIVVHRSDFFRDPWSLFDFFVVGVALVPAVGQLSVLRTLRVLRVLRMVTAVPSLKRVVTGLFEAVPGMVSIIGLMALIYYVFAVMATGLYGASFPELFGTLPRSLFTLFTVMTLEGWVDGVVKPVMETYPYAWVFFFTYIIICTFMVLNLFIAVVVNALQVVHTASENEERAAERGMIESEAAPILAELRELKAEIASLRAEIARRAP